MEFTIDGVFVSLLYYYSLAVRIEPMLRYVSSRTHGVTVIGIGFSKETIIWRFILYDKKSSIHSDPEW